MSTGSLKRQATAADQVLSTAKRCKLELEEGELAVELNAKPGSTAAEVTKQCETEAAKQGQSLTSYNWPQLKQSVKIISVHCVVPGCQWSANSRFNRLSHHLRNEHHLPRFSCFAGSQCTARFTRLEALLRHHKACHPSLHQWSCPQCSLTFAKSKEVNVHQFLAHFKGQFKCSRCTYQADCREQILVHFDREHLSPQKKEKEVASVDVPPFGKTRPYVTRTVKCAQEDCAEYFLDADEFLQHMASAHGRQQFPCPQAHCSQSFEQIQDFVEHIHSAHASIVSWKCANCPVDFDCYSKLYEHRVHHHEEGIFQCTKCSQVFKFRSDAMAHFAEIHGASQ